MEDEDGSLYDRLPSLRRRAGRRGEPEEGTQRNTRIRTTPENQSTASNIEAQYNDLLQRFNRLEDVLASITNSTDLTGIQQEVGNVKSGVDEDVIQKHLMLVIQVGSPDPEDESCCICQEKYADGEELGQLDCGHGFHYNCIKQWLIQKNDCPLCKKTAILI